MALKKNKDSDKGYKLDKRKSGLLIPGYIASPIKLNYSDREQLERFYERLEKEAGVFLLHPFRPFSFSGSLKESISYEGVSELLRDIDTTLMGIETTVHSITYEELIPKSKLMIALLDGDVSEEVGYYAGKYKGEKPIIGISGVLNSSGNGSNSVNSSLRYFLDKGPCKGYFFEGDTAYDEVVKLVPKLFKKK